MKLAIAIVVVLAGLLLGAVVLNLTPEGREVVRTVFEFVAGLAGGIWSVALGIGFFLLPWAVGRYFRRGVEWVDGMFDPNTPFSRAAVVLIALVFGIASAGLQLFALQLVNGNAAVARFLASIGTSGLLAFGPVSVLAWAAFGFLGFVVGFFLLWGRRPAAKS